MPAKEKKNLETVFLKGEKYGGRRHTIDFIIHTFYWVIAENIKIVFMSLFLSDAWLVIICINDVMKI